MTNTALWLRNGKFVDLDVDSLSVSWINLENVGFICRIGLVYRITCLLVLKISTDILYLMYSNSNEILFSYFFGALSICLVSSVILYLMIFECSHLNQAHCTAVQQSRLSSNRTKKNRNVNASAEALNIDTGEIEGHSGKTEIKTTGETVHAFDFISIFIPSCTNICTWTILQKLFCHVIAKYTNDDDNIRSLIEPSQADAHFSVMLTKYHNWKWTKITPGIM